MDKASINVSSFQQNQALLLLDESLYYNVS